jgi:hypothetical protein
MNDFDPVDLYALADQSTPWSLHVAVTLGVAERLEAGPMDVGELAAAVGADAGALGRVLRQLAGHGVFVEEGEGRFALNQAARGLLDPGMRIFLDLNGIGGRFARAWSGLADAVRTGRAGYPFVFGVSFWDDLAAHPELSESFDAAMAVGHPTPDPEVLPASDWDGVRTVVDVGGGTGAQLAQVLRAHPSLRGILVDLPGTVARSAEVFAAAGVSARATVVGQSFFDPLPAGADLYLVTNVLADWPDADALRLLRRCAEAARPAGRLVVIAGVSPERESPELMMLVLVGGRSRSLAQFAELAGEAGLRVSATGRQRAGRFLVECRPV